MNSLNLNNIYKAARLRAWKTGKCIVHSGEQMYSTFDENVLKKGVWSVDNDEKMREMWISYDEIISSTKQKKYEALDSGGLVLC